MSKLGEHLTGGWKKQLGTKKEFEKSRKKIAGKMTGAEYLKKHGNLWGFKHKRNAQMEGESRSDFERGN